MNLTLSDMAIIGYSMLMTNHDLVHEETGASYDHLPIVISRTCRNCHLVIPHLICPKGNICSLLAIIVSSAEIQQLTIWPDGETENNKKECDN